MTTQETTNDTDTSRRSDGYSYDNLLQRMLRRGAYRLEGNADPDTTTQEMQAWYDTERAEYDDMYGALGTSNTHRPKLRHFVAAFPKMDRTRIHYGTPRIFGWVDGVDGEFN